MTRPDAHPPTGATEKEAEKAGEMAERNTQTSRKKKQWVFIKNAMCEIRLGNTPVIWDALLGTRNITFMALWEYKVITSGLHGFASPALLEAHLNALGKDEWEILHFQTQPNNPLAFHGLARRATTRDWTPPEIAVATAPKHTVYEPAPPVTKPTAQTVAEEKLARTPALADESEAPKTKVDDASLRPMRNTERDLDPDAEDEEDDWDNWEENEDDLPSFFEAIKPHLRRNQKGPGMSVAVDYLAKRWEQRESDLVGALKECGFTIPETEEADPDYFEFEGDLYWVNRNNRGQMFINTREKPRPTFRIAQAKKLASDDPAASELVAERAAEKAEIEKRNAERIERAERQATATAAAAAAKAAKLAAAATPPADEQRPAESRASSEVSSPADNGTSAAALPGGSELLDKIRPLMRRNRRGPGYSGSIGFLARALKQSDAALTAALASLGLNIPSNPNDKPVYVEIDNGLYWVNKDNRGGVWINGREKREGAPKPGTESDQEASATGSGSASTESADAPADASSPTDSPAETLVPISEVSPRSATLPESASTPDSSVPAESAIAFAPDADAEGKAEPETESVDTLELSAESASENPESSVPFESTVPSISTNPTLAAARPLLKATKRGGNYSGEIGDLARTLEKNQDEFVSSLVGAGLVLPNDLEEKPAYLEQDGEVFWLTKNTTDGSLWLNAKVAKPARKSGGSTRPRAARKTKPEEPAESS